MSFEFDDLIKLSLLYRQHLLICFIANVKEETNGYNDYAGNSVSAEFLSSEHYERIVKVLLNDGFYVCSYKDEEDFIKDCARKRFQHTERQVLVINSAQKGTSIGRKALIPAICDFYGFWYVGSNPYLRCLLRDKHKTNCILENLGFPCTKSYLYLPNEGWLLGNRPQAGENVIIKLNYEASSIGLSEKNVFPYSKGKDFFINGLATKFRQAVIVQNLFRDMKLSYLLFHHKIYCLAFLFHLHLETVPKWEIIFLHMN